MSKSETSGDDPSRPWQSYHTAYTNAKAGMEGVDKEKVQRTIYEMSKGSKYFENEERKEASMKQKIENMRARCAELTEADLSHYQKVADMRILELEATRDLSRIWLHVDMDAFYAAVETLSNPSLKGKPMAVGSMSMISTANYEARRYGVRAAMPGFIARKLCPELIFVPVDFKKYTYYSGLTRKVFQKYDPNFMAASLDEAYLDITNVCKERGIVSTEVAEELRQCVFEATGLTCSAGVAPNRLLAKVCSDINKPNGQFVLPSDRTVVMKFISTLPIRKIGGIGKVTENILKDVFGIKTCEEMLQKSCFLYALFSSSSADFFLSAGLGIGSTDTPQVRSRKSISNERTFSATKDQTFLFQKIVELAEMLSSDMEREGLRGRTLTLKLKTASFEVRSRAVTLQNYISSTEDILKHASKLLKAELPLSLRLLGLRISHFSEDSDGSPSDPTQKTISKFIKYSDANDNLSKINSDTDLPNNDTTSYDSRDQFHSLPVSDCTDNNCILEAENRTNMNDGYNDKVYDSSSKSEPSHLEVSNNVCLANKRTRFSDDEAGTSFSKKDTTLLWENGYKCLLCGIELPPSFTEERQEHSDFHLAERLQEEESCNNHIHHPINQRFRQKDEIANRSRKGKKQKSSPVDGKHIPIDMFFVKRSQNL